MAAKHTHIFVGDPGYLHLLPTGPVQPAPGDKFDLSDEVAATVGADFEPTAEWVKAHAPKTEPDAAPADPTDQEN